MPEGHASRYRPLLPGLMRGGPLKAPSRRLATHKRSVVKRAYEGYGQRKAKVLFAVGSIRSKSNELKRRYSAIESASGGCHAAKK
jgi:hypothetical protein